MLYLIIFTLETKDRDHHRNRNNELNEQEPLICKELH